MGLCIFGMGMTYVLEPQGQIGIVDDGERIVHWKPELEQP